MRALTAALATSLALVPTGTAGAAFPGQNGKIAFGSPQGIETIRPDGTDRTQIVPSGQDPAWSPDGRKIAYADGAGLAVAGGDGSGQTYVLIGIEANSPAWSPDGQRIAFAQTGEFCDPETELCEFNDDIVVVDADGTGYVDLTNTPRQSEGAPAWSPDGATIAFHGNGIETIHADGTGRTTVRPSGVSPNWSPDGRRIAYVAASFGQPAEIHTADADGSNDVQLTTNSLAEGAPAWSPDGRKIAFHRHSPELVRPGADVWTVNADGTGELKLTTDGHLQDHTNFTPDWQPVPYTGYARPRGATTMYLPLVPAFSACATPNRTHGAPLSFGACAPSAQTSAQLTVGTPDANGRPARARGWIDLRTVPGNPATAADEADVLFQVTITDVRRSSDLSDYAGELTAQANIRRTDREGGVAATSTDFPFPVVVPCANTADATVGSACTISTTVDSVVPGAIVESARTIWALERLEVYDGAADGASGTPPNSLFAVQGLFVP
jgi:Tol biopolymer transport system component